MGYYFVTIVLFNSPFCLKFYYQELPAFYMMQMNYSDNQETCKYIFFEVALIFKFLTLAFEALQNLATRELYTALSIVSDSLPAL